jgi:predicted phosphodiesterase
MDRRDFMKKAMGAGILIAASSLPVVADDKNQPESSEDIFPKRGNFERLSLAYSTVHIGLDKPFSVLHITDTHLTAANPDEDEKKQELHKVRTQTFGGHQEEALRDSLDWARKHVDYVIHTGDLIDWQSEGNFDLVKKYFGAQIIGNLGNHEYSTNMWLSDPKFTETEEGKALSKPELSKVFPFDLSFHSQVVGGVNFIAIDDVYSTVTEEQVVRFKHEAQKGLPIVLCMHVPFYTEDIYMQNRRFWTSGKGGKFTSKDFDIDEEYGRQLNDPVTSQFIKYLKEEPLLKAIIAGHTHITTQDSFSPTAVEIVTGSNFLFHAREILFV